MPMSPKDSVEQTKLDREARVAQERAELDARTFDANEDRKARIEQEQRSLAASILQADKERRNRTIVALISALAAIGAALIAALVGIDKLGGGSLSRYSVIVATPSGAPQEIFKTDVKTGQAWELEKSKQGSRWRPIQQ